MSTSQNMPDTNHLFSRHALFTSEEARTQSWYRPNQMNFINYHLRIFRNSFKGLDLQIYDPLDFPHELLLIVDDFLDRALAVRSHRACSWIF